MEKINSNAIPDLLEAFEKVELTDARRNGTPGLWVAFLSNDSKLTLSPELTRAFDIKNNERFDLYRNGNTFALKRNNASGVLRANKKDNELRARFNSRSAIKTVKAAIPGTTIFKAHIISDSVFIFFKEAE